MNKITIIITDYEKLTDDSLLFPLMCNNFDFHMDTNKGQILVNEPIKDVLEIYNEVGIPNCTFIEVDGSISYNYNGNINNVVGCYDNVLIESFK